MEVGRETVYLDDKDIAVIGQTRAVPGCAEISGTQAASGRLQGRI